MAMPHSDPACFADDKKHKSAMLEIGKVLEIFRNANCTRKDASNNLDFANANCTRTDAAQHLTCQVYRIKRMLHDTQHLQVLSAI